LEEASGTDGVIDIHRQIAADAQYDKFEPGFFTTSTDNPMSGEPSI